MPKKIIVLVVILVIIAGVVFLISPKVTKPPTTGLVMKVARYYWPGQYWVEIADKKGWFRQAGLKVELIDTNPGYFASLDKVAKGSLDTQDFYLFDVVKYNAQGVELVMVVNSDLSSGAETLVAKKEIETIRDLKGKRIGVPRYTGLEYLLCTALQRSGIAQIGDVIMVDVPAEKTAEEFRQGKVDAIMAWDPFVTEAIEKSGGRKLFDSSEISGVSPVGWVFKRRFIQERPGDVEAFVKVWHKTTEFIKNNPQEAYGIIAGIYQKPVAEVEAFTKINKILSLQDNLLSYTHSGGFESLYGTARRINDYILRQGLTDKQLDPENFLDSQFIKRLK